MGAGEIFRKILLALFLMTAYRMSPFRPDPSRWTVPLNQRNDSCFNLRIMPLKVFS
jgi:hypothetical protein